MIPDAIEPNKITYAVYHRLSVEHVWYLYATRDESWIENIRKWATYWGDIHSRTFKGFQVGIVRMESGTDIPNTLLRTERIEILFGAEDALASYHWKKEEG